MAVAPPRRPSARRAITPAVLVGTTIVTGASGSSPLAARTAPASASKARAPWATGVTLIGTSRSYGWGVTACRQTSVRAANEAIGDAPDGSARPDLSCSPPVDRRDGDPLLRIERLTKRYPAVTAIDDLSVEVPRGRIGLVGANGAGKTTTFRLLLGLAHPTTGTVEVCGVNVAEDPIGVRSRLGYMPEHDCLPLDQTAADVVSTFGELSGLPARAARQRASDILDLVGLDEARFRPISGFSTGMRQRTKLAQALVGDPELVLLDEPTAGLDPLGREEMLALIGRLGTFGISVLMATHLLDDVQQVCDHVVMIDAGRLVVAGPTDSLLERTGVVTVDVGIEGARLVAGLAGVSLQAVTDDGVVEVTIDGSRDLDLLRDVIADLGLPLYRLTSRLTSLDEVFLRHARSES
jgi:ABC-2 type transport system ATP-binding protein